MMKITMVVAMLVAVSAAQQYQQYRSQLRSTPILRHEYQLQPDGRFQYAYETGNGIRAQAVGDQKAGGRDGPVQSIQGQFAWTSDDGVPVDISYIADENGYQPRGAALPTPPPIPEAILKSLELIRRSQRN